MRKIIIYIVLLLCLIPAFPLQAQSNGLGRYWDDTDFSDTTLIDSKELTSKLIDFLFSFTDGDEHRFDSLSIVGLGTVLDMAKANMEVYEFILQFALRGYTAMGRTAVTDYLLNYPKLAEGEITAEEGRRLDSITEPFQKVKVGAKAPDYKGVTIDGKIYSIYGSKARRTLVVFWSTDCEYCHDFLVQIRKHLNLKRKYELVTFALAESQEEVTAMVKKMRLRGYHFYDELRWEGKAFLDYHITSTPTVFLLDEKKTIVCKPYDWNELKEWLKRNK